MSKTEKYSPPDASSASGESAGASPAASPGQEASSSPAPQMTQASSSPSAPSSKGPLTAAFESEPSGAPVPSLTGALTNMAPSSSPVPLASNMGAPVPEALVRVATGQRSPSSGSPQGSTPGSAPLSKGFVEIGEIGEVPEAATSAMLRHFRVDRRIAAGGMGEVFLGYDTSLSRPVALKTIRPELVRDQTFLARFVREATAQANVVHPHVVQVYFVGEDKGQWFLAMQIVDGGSLHDTLAHKKKMRWQDAARHMTSVCEGLVVAEGVGIVHRDIKPSNILLDKAGRALLSDFGLAASKGAVDKMTASTTTGTTGGDARAPVQPSGSQLQLATVTQVGMVMGTPEYVAPEQLKAGPLDARADMYALGATFFHLVSGQPAMPVTNLGEAIDKYAKGYRAPLLSTVAPAVPKAFAQVIDRCLETDPKKRYATMQELADALHKAMPQPEIPASPVLRALVWLFDVAPFIALSYATYARFPWLGPLLFFVAGALGIKALGATPGVWLMRLRLRTRNDGDVTWKRGFLRFLVQHGWYVPLAVGWSALYGSSNLDVFLLVGAVWLALSVLGSLGAFSQRGQALHDVITRTRLLVDLRYR